MAAALVLFMTPGLALFYGGMVRGKNVLGMLMQNVFAMGLLAILWVAIVFSLAFGDAGNGGVIGNFDFAFMKDVGVPLPALADLVGGVAKIAANHDLMISVIAHAGDGNTHPLIVFDPADAAMVQRAQKAFGEIMDLAVGLGGTITGEHGVGRLKRPWLAAQLGPEAMEFNRRIKKALDPDGILNPGAAI